jgi:hypothetical protein
MASCSRDDRTREVAMGSEGYLGPIEFDLRRLIFMVGSDIHDWDKWRASAQLLKTSYIDKRFAVCHYGQK